MYVCLYAKYTAKMVKIHFKNIKFKMDSFLHEFTNKCESNTVIVQKIKVFFPRYEVFKYVNI